MKPITSPVYVRVFTKPSWKNKDNMLPLKMELRHKRERTTIHLNHWVKCDVYEATKIRTSRRKEVIELKEIIGEYINEAKRIVKLLQENTGYSFQEFEFIWKGGKSPTSSLRFFQKKIDQLIRDQSVATAQGYRASYRAFEGYFGKGFDLKGITGDDLYEFEAHLKRKKGMSPNTIATYMAYMKHIYGMAQKAQEIKPTENPFVVSDYKPEKRVRVKESLSVEDLEKLFTNKPEPYSKTDRALAFWMFSFMGEGTNFTDIVRLKFKDRSGSFFKYTRSKRKGRRVITMENTILVLPEMDLIIDKWGNRIQDHEDYVFPVLEKGMSEGRKVEVTKNSLKVINKYLKKYGEDHGFSIKLTMNIARHTFASRMKKGGVGMDAIQEMLDHSNPATTKIYISTLLSAEDERRKIEERQNLLGLGRMRIA